jgi:integrase/recombinase XerD
MSEQLPLFSTPLKDVEPAPVPRGPAMLPLARSAPTALRASSPLTAAVVAWREHMDKQGASPHTVKAFGGDLKLFTEFTGGGKSIGQLTTRELNDWLLWLRNEKKCSPKSYARRITSLKSFFRWLCQTNVIGKDPAAPLIQQSVLSPLPDFLTNAEVEAARQAAQALRLAEKSDIRPLVLFTLLLQTGIKKNECLALHPNHVDLSNPDEPVLWIRYKGREDDAHSNEAKYRYKERKLKLEKSWIPIYREYLAAYEPRDKLFPWSPRRLEYLLEDINKAAGLEKHISFEMCRWTCAVHDARAGLDSNAIRQKLGLSKIQWREIGMKLEKLVEKAE